jgi:heme exporter protein D
MNLGPNAAFIVSAYTAAILIVAALVAWIVLDSRRQKRILSDLEARGITRRSGRVSEERS